MDGKSQNGREFFLRRDRAERPGKRDAGGTYAALSAQPADSDTLASDRDDGALETTVTDSGGGDLVRRPNGA